MVRGRRTRDTRHKLKQERARSDIRRQFFLSRTVKQWDRLPSEGA